MSPFDYLNSINLTKKNLIVDEQSEKDYVPFIVNRGLGYFSDTVLLANEMNVNCNLDSKMQYDFLRSTVKKRKRFSKWLKREESDKIETIKEYFGYSYPKAKEVEDLISESDLESMRESMFKGGKN